MLRLYMRYTGKGGSVAILRLLATASQSLEQHLTEMDELEEEQILWWVWEFAAQELGFK